MPRGRKIVRPSLLKPPRRPEGAEALIDAAAQGWWRNAQVRAIGRASEILRQHAPERGSWIDGTNHPRDPRQRGQSRDRYLTLLVQAVRLLMREHEWTQHRACREVADRLLLLFAPLRPEMIVDVLGVPRRIVDIAVDEQRHAAARNSLMKRLQLACRSH